MIPQPLHILLSRLSRPVHWHPYAHSVNLAATFCSQAQRRTLQHSTIQLSSSMTIKATADWSEDLATATVLVIAPPKLAELSILEKLPPGVKLAGIGKSYEDFSHFTDEQWAAVNVLFKMGGGKDYANTKDIWPRLTGLKWVHSSATGVEYLLSPEQTNGQPLFGSHATITNSRGVYNHSLSEYALAGCLWFAKQLPRFLQAKHDKKWDICGVEELRDKTMGIVGYGSLGRATAELARAYKMRVVASRRTTNLPAAEVNEGLLDKVYSPAQLHELLAESDYVVLATPYTPDTHHLINAAAIAAMKPTGVIINIGRGNCIDEPALIEALAAQRIKGAALDVFEGEPLPDSSPLWDLPNVLLTPHCAARTDRHVADNVELFVANVQRYVSGEGGRGC